MLICLTERPTASTAGPTRQSLPSVSAAIGNVVTDPSARIIQCCSSRCGGSCCQSTRSVLRQLTAELLLLDSRLRPILTNSAKPAPSVSSLPPSGSKFVSDLCGLLYLPAEPRAKSFNVRQTFPWLMDTSAPPAMYQRPS
jgi:hypothetical protein